MEKIRLSNGKEYDTLSVGIAHSGHLFIRVPLTLSKAATAFSKGTDEITYYPSGKKPVVINGFTELAYIVNENDCVRVALTRPIMEELIDNG